MDIKYTQSLGLPQKTVAIHRRERVINNRAAIQIKSQPNQENQKNTQKSENETFEMSEKFKSKI